MTTDLTDTTRQRAVPNGATRRIAHGPGDTYLIERDGADVTVTVQDSTATDAGPLPHPQGDTGFKRRSSVTGWRSDWDLYS